MIVKNLSFGSITIDMEIYLKDVIIDNGSIKKREKAGSKKYSSMFGHTPHITRREYSLELQASHYRDGPQFKPPGNG